MATWKAVLFDDGSIPVEAVPLVADIVAMPCSRASYARVLTDALLSDPVYREMRGYVPLEALRVPKRINAPRLRVGPVDEPSADAELEAAAADESAAAEHVLVWRAT